MSERGPQQRLSDISTHWSVVFEAHRSGESAKHAQTELMERYFGAVYRYLLSVTESADAAADLAQDFALRFVRGDFHRADPDRGRFRDYVKASVRNMLHDHASRKRTATRRLMADSFAHPAVSDEPAPLDDEFFDRWREELLECAWRGLEEIERQTGTLYYTSLRWRSEHRRATAGQFAEKIRAETGCEFTEAGIRQLIRRGRQKFAELLLAEVIQSLESTTSAEQIEEELADLQLLPYCRAAFDKWKAV